jgi:hypothetical protein
MPSRHTTIGLACFHCRQNAVEMQVRAIPAAVHCLKEPDADDRCYSRSAQAICCHLHSGDRSESILLHSSSSAWLGQDVVAFVVRP